MKKIENVLLGVALLLTFTACGKSKPGSEPVPPVSKGMNIVLKKVNDQVISSASVQLAVNAADLKISFSARIDRSFVANAVTWSSISTSSNVPVSTSFANGDSVLIIRPVSPLVFLTLYNVTISNTLKSTDAVALADPLSLNIRTGIDTTDKFSRIPDNALLDTVQKRTFKYFWDYGHPFSGLARDKTNTSELDDCSIGGTGFGIL